MAQSFPKSPLPFPYMNSDIPPEELPLLDDAFDDVTSGDAPALPDDPESWKLFINSATGAKHE